MEEIIQLLNKAIIHAKNDAIYLLPVIGAVQIFIIGICYKKTKLIYTSLFLIIFFIFTFPFAKLIPNLGSDAFSELQKINLSEVFFYVKTLNFFAGWSIKHYLLWSFILVFYFLTFFVYFLLSKKVRFLSFLKINYIIVIVIIILPTFLNFHKVSILYKSSENEKINQSKNIIYEPKDLLVKNNNKNNLSIFLYIGESTSRLHWSIYDYFRSTNSNLEKFNYDNSIIIYDNVHSTHTHTSPSLLDALTIKKESENSKSLKVVSDYIRYPIVDILNETSINTKLFSTQAKSGSWNLASGLIFKNSKEKNYSFKYNLGNANNINKNKLYDHEFLEKLIDKIKNDDIKENNFYVFHSYAGHGNYKKNIPKNYHFKIDDFYSNHSNEAIFGKFYKNNQKEFLENYDSAMSYVSDNIALALKEISELKKPIIFIYTSDHGESPLTGRAHDSSRYVWEMSTVPFIVYFNKEAELKYPELFKKIKTRSILNNKEILSNFPSLILEIYGIEIFNKNGTLLEISNCEFGQANCKIDYHIIRNQLNSLGVVKMKYSNNKSNNFIDNTDRPTTLSNLKYYFSNINKDLKICSHRTNSIARFIRFNSILDCMELDIIINDKFLDVAQSKELSTSLNLEELIKIQKNKINTLWLDVKNINSPNDCLQLYENLKRMNTQNNKINFFIEFPSKIINDLSRYENCIQKIKKFNYPISYYVPNNTSKICIDNQIVDNYEIKTCQYLEKIMKKLFNSSLFTDISFDFNNYEFLKKSKFIEKFYLNTWHIPDKEIINISDKKFRLIIPFNDDLNYN